MAKSSSHWISAFSDCELPVLYNSKHRLHKLQENEQDITITVLADIARQDPGFSISLLRHVGQNTKKEITTLSHAISLISIPLVIKRLTESPTLEKTLDKKMITRIMNVYAYQYQNAFMARQWSMLRKESENNEIFTAALNRGFVRFMLYLIEADKGIALENVYLTSADDHKQREKEILGESVDNIAESITKHWKLPELIRESYSGKHHNPKITGIRLSAELMRHIYTHHSVQYPEELITRIAEYIRVPVDRAPGKINSIIATTIRNSFAYLPVQPLLLNLMCSPGVSKKHTNPTVIQKKSRQKIIQDCIKILRSNESQLSTKNKISISTKAMLTGLGFSRVLFLSLDKKENTLRLIERNVQAPAPDIKNLTISLELNKLFAQLLKKEQTLTITAKNQHKYSALLPKTLRPSTPLASMIIHSFYIHNKAAGCFFADHGHTDNKLTTKQLQAFKIICKELKAAIESSLIHKKPEKKVA